MPSASHRVEHRWPSLPSRGLRPGGPGRCRALRGRSARRGRMRVHRRPGRGTEPRDRVADDGRRGPPSHPTAARAGSYLPGRHPERARYEHDSSVYDSPIGSSSSRLSSAKHPARAIDVACRHRAAPRPATDRRRTRAPSRGDHVAVVDRHLADRRGVRLGRPAPCKYGGVTGIPSPGELRFDRTHRRVGQHRRAPPGAARTFPTRAARSASAASKRRDPYDVRWFPNRWPALAPGRAARSPVDGRRHGTRCFRGRRVRGRAVLARARRVARDACRSTQVRKVVDLWAERTEALLARPEIEYVLVFENRGREVGATIDHPHGQIYGYPFVPPAPAREVRVAGDGCAVCARGRSRARRRRTHRRASAATGSRGCRSRPATRTACASRRARTSARCPRSTTPRATTSRALLVDALGRYDRLWPAPHAGYRFPYLLWFHQAPAAGGDEWHVHAHVAPPLRAAGVQRYVASGELGQRHAVEPGRARRRGAALRDA